MMNSAPVLHWSRIRFNLEAYSRRENIKFENIPEGETGKEDTEKVSRTFLETELGLAMLQMLKYSESIV